MSPLILEGIRIIGALFLSFIYLGSKHWIQGLGDFLLTMHFFPHLDLLLHHSSRAAQFQKHQARHRAWQPIIILCILGLIWEWDATTRQNELFKFLKVVPKKWQQEFIVVNKNVVAASLSNRISFSLFIFSSSFGLFFLSFLWWEQHLLFPLRSQHLFIFSSSFVLLWWSSISCLIVSFTITT